MRSLSIFAIVAAVAAWLLWVIRPTEYRHFVPSSFESPYLEFAFETLVALATGTVLLLGVVGAQREMRDTLLPWSSSRLVRLQFVVLAAAAITGLFGIRQLFQMDSRLGGDWSAGNTLWFSVSPAIAMALSPWIVFVAAAIVAAVAGRLGGALSVAVLVFDLLSMSYLAFIFAHLGYWACLSCSGPLG